MRECVVISNAPAFVQAAQESIRLALEEWSLTIVRSWKSCEEILGEKNCKIVLIDPQTAVGLPKSFAQIAEDFPDVWFIIVGAGNCPGCMRIEAPLKPHSLTFFMQNQRGDNRSLDQIQDPQFLAAIYPILLTHVWNGLLNYWVLSDRTMIMMAAQNMHMPNLENMHLLPILVKTVHRTRTEVSRAVAGKDHLYFMDLLTNEILQNVHAGAVLDRFAQQWAVLLYIDQYPCVWEDIELRCRKVQETAAADNWQLGFFVGEPVLPENLVESWEQLSTLASSDVGYRAQIVRMRDVQRRNQAGADFPDMQAWKTMLSGGQCEKVQQQVAACLADLAEKGVIDVPWLGLFRDEFLKMICEVLQTNGIPAAEILSEPLSGVEFERASTNVQVMEGWIGRLLDNLAHYMENEKLDTVVKRAQKYILQNLNQELTRDSIAEHVFVSSGYLGRLFKKETGMNLPEYIYHERMALAEKMLEQTELNVTNIAMNVGFSNFPYFSTQFKKYSGYSPAEFRKLKHSTL